MKELAIHSAEGHGPTVILVHGVGVGPSSFQRTAALLRSDHRVMVVARPGYRLDTAAVPDRFDIAGQVDDLADLVRDEERATVVGVSGGATLALALAMERPPGLDAVFAHEPLVGPLAPALHAGVLGLRDRLASEEGFGPTALVAELVGVETWNRIGAAHRAEIARRGPVIELEVPAFCAFEPTATDLSRAADVPVTVSVGRRSGTARRDAAQVVVEHASARQVHIPDAGHLPQLDHPEALATAVSRFIRVGSH